MLDVETKSETTKAAGLNGEDAAEEAAAFVFPAGLEQSRYWILDQLGGASTASNMAIAFRLEGTVDDGLVERSLRELVLRHEALRTTFQMVEGELSQIISEQPRFSFSVSNLRELPIDEAQKKAEELVLEHGRVRIDLDQGPVFHARLLHVSNQSHYLAYTIHHIACDGWSNGILVRDFAAIYSALAEHREPALPTLPFQFADFTVWQKEWLESNAAEQAIAFWRENLRRDMPAVDLPTDRPRRASKSAPGNIESRLLPARLSGELKEYCRTHDATMHQVLLAAFEGFLSRYTGQEEFLLGSTIANRTQPGMENVVGRFANPQVIPADVRGNPSFRELVERVSAWSAKSYAHQDLPFSRLMEEFQLDQSGATSQFLQVYFVYQKAFMQPQQAGGLKIIPRPSVSGGVNFDFLVSVVERAEGPRLQVEYNTLLFEKQRVRRFIAMFARLLEAAMSDDSIEVSQLPLLEQAEAEELRSAGVGPPQPGLLKNREDESIPAFLDRKADDRGSATAIVSGTERATWSDLRSRSLKFSEGLKARGIQAGQTVALRMEQTADAAAAAIGTLRLGAVLLPIAQSTPVEEWKLLQARFHPELLLVGHEFAEKLAGSISFEKIAKPGDEAGAALPAYPAPDCIAWLNLSIDGENQYAATEVSHRGALHAITGAVWNLDLGPGDVVAVWPAAGSAETWTDLLLGLVSGATVVDCGAILSSDLEKVFDKERVTAAIAAPADWMEPLRQDRCVRRICRGPGLLPAAIERAAGPAQKAAVLYSSPFSAGAFATARLIPSAAAPDRLPHCLLAALPGEELTLIDAAKNQVPFGVPGELMTGSGTSEPAPTGYLARYTPECGLELAGRGGRAVQMHGNRGYRLRLEDLESLLYRHSQVREVEAAVVEDGGSLILTAFATGPAGHRPSDQDLKAFLRAEAPPHLAEAEIVVVGSIPRRADGSVNLSRLPLPSVSRQPNPESPAAAVPAGDDIERALVHIWEETFGKKGIGIRDSFFSLGGYSLMIVRLFARINKHFQKSLPITTIFNAPTIEQLAEILRGHAGYSALVPVQPKGTKPPFFLLLSYLIYDGVRSALGEDQPIYGLRELENEAEMTVEDRAAGYAKQIRSVAPHGPYHLGGWCAAGPMAVETARQLTEAGEQVASLVLFDSWRPGYAEELAVRQKGSPESTRKAVLRRKIRFHRIQLEHLSGPQRVRYVWNAGFAKMRSARNRYFLRHLGMTRSFCTAFGIAQPDFMQNTGSDTLAVVQNFKGQPFPGRITLIRARESTYIPGAEPACGWNTMAGEGVDVLFTPGTHESMFLGSNLTAFGSLLSRSLGGSAQKPLSAILDSSNGRSHNNGSSCAAASSQRKIEAETGDACEL